MTKLSLMATVLIWAVGCFSSSSPVLNTDPIPAPGLHKDKIIEIDGISRTFDFFVPVNSDSSPSPLVFLFHGARSDTDALTGETISKAPYSVWMDIAETENLILVYPQGATGPDNRTGWNDCRTDASTNPSLDDVAFVDELIAYFSTVLPVNTNRVYASGTSNGGHMSLRLALELSDKIAAVAPVVAAMPAISCNTPVNPVSVLLMNGTADPLLPYLGGEVAAETGGRGTVLSTQASIEYWVSFNQANGSPTVRNFEDSNASDNSTVTSFSYTGGLEGTEVVLYEITGGGHLEPSIREQYLGFVENSLGAQNHDIEMADEIWNFFRNKTLD